MKYFWQFLMVIFATSGYFFLHAEDMERTVLYYDDLGNPENSPSLVRGTHLNTWQGKSNPEYSIAFDVEKVVLAYKNLNPSLIYGITVCMVTSEHRCQKLIANGSTIYDNYTLSQTPEKKSYILPNGIIAQDCSLILEFINISGKNAVVSEVTLFYDGTDLKKNGKIQSNSTTSFSLGIQEAIVTSSLDQSKQKCAIIIPENCSGKAQPLVVILHSWTGNYAQKVNDFGPIVQKKSLYAIFPDYRGANRDNIKAMGSDYAVRDIIDAVNHMKANFPIDSKRIYVAGASGGGHMALLMAGRHPEIWAAVSAWCPITDLEMWYCQNTNYAIMIKSCIGAEPGESPELDIEYKKRSPVNFIENIAKIPLQIYHGAQDSIVPVEQTDVFIKKLQEMKGYYQYIREEQGGHTINPEKMLSFLERHTKQ